jgi:YesN/AraC family two-component response regulator
MGTILVVDDEPDLLEAMRRVLGRVAGRVLTALNGKEALTILAQTQVDAVLADIAMPVVNGLALLADMRASGSETPVVFLSGMEDRSYVLAALRLGAFDFLEKPYAVDELERIMEMAVAHGCKLRELRVELEALSGLSTLTAEQLETLRSVKRSLFLMRQERARLEAGRLPLLGGLASA